MDVETLTHAMILALEQAGNDPARAQKALDWLAEVYHAAGVRQEAEESVAVQEAKKTPGTTDDFVRSITT